METMINAKVALLQALLDGEGYGLDLIDRVAERTKGKVKLLHGSGETLALIGLFLSVKSRYQPLLRRIFSTPR